jgi:superfamily II DNA helicase RecQ
VAGAAHARAQQQSKPERQLPLTQAQLCEMAGLPPDAPWVPEQLTDEQLASVMKAVWGHDGFRGQQLPLIRAALQGRSMLGVLPTGLGKSMTFQLPALVMQGAV